MSSSNLQYTSPSFLADRSANADNFSIGRPSPFNERGVLAEPSIILSRPAGSAGKQPAKADVSFDVFAHEIEPGRWVSSCSWACRADDVPGDGSLPTTSSPTHATRSDAVNHAIETGLRQIRDQLASRLALPLWSSRLESLRAWCSDTMAAERAIDAALPLHGKTVIDLCSGGLGGFGLGLTALGARVSLACEIDDEARAVYEKNVRPLAVAKDLCDLDGKALRCDILTVGLLCQAFSAAGKRKGFADPALREVYEHTLRLLAEIDAGVVIVECAREFLTQDGGKDAAVVRKALMAAGYRVQHRVFDAANFGVAQCRERSFIVATRHGSAHEPATMGYIFPTPSAPSTTIEDILERGVAATIASAEIAAKSSEPAARVGGRAVVGLIGGRDCQGYRVYSRKGLSPTLTASGGGRGRFGGAVAVKGGARGFTAREAGRLQGLPEHAAQHPLYTRAMMQAGNGVAIPLVVALGRQLGL